MRPNSSRFRCASSRLDFKRLLASGRRGLGCLAALSLCLHLALTMWTGHQADSKAVQPLTARFVKRAPRLTKPLELKKRPRPKRRPLQRKMVSVKAKVARQALPSQQQYARLLGRLARPDVSVYRSAALSQRDLDPNPVAASIHGAVQAKQSVDMSLELLDVESLNIGKYHAMAIQDPNDKRSIRGFLHLAFVTIQGVREGATIRGRNYASDESRYRRGLRRLIEAINKHTDIKADLTANVALSSDEVFKTPWLYACNDGYPVWFTEPEQANVGRYLAQGGFVFFEAGIRPGSPGHRCAHGIFEEALNTQGLVRRRDWSMVRLPSTHPVYHCFFDFDRPPTGGDFWNIRYKDYELAFFTDHLIEYLEGYEGSDGHLYGIVSLKSYHNPWGDWGPDGTFKGQGLYGPMDPGRALQFGVNLIVFALTQEGSITNQVMDALR